MDQSHLCDYIMFYYNLNKNEKYHLRTLKMEMAIYLVHVFVVYCHSMESVIVLCFVVRYFMSILVLQSS